MKSKIKSLSKKITGKTTKGKSISKKAPRSLNTLINQMSKEKQTRIEIFQGLADLTNLSKTNVEKVFASLSQLVQAHMKKKGSGEFIIPMTGVKIKRIKKNATKTRKMFSPLTQKEELIPGKPARLAIKIAAMKSLKEAVSTK